MAHSENNTLASLKYCKKTNKKVHCINCEACPLLCKRMSNPCSRQKNENSKINREVISIPQGDLGPKDIRQIDLIPELSTRRGYKNKIKATKVFSQYGFAYPVSKPTAVNTAKFFIIIRLAYLPTKKITEKRSIFVPHVIHEMVEVLGHK